MQILEYNLNNEKVKYLISSDNKLGKLIKFIGSSNLIIETDGFKCLVKYIIGQQISDKARETIWQRFCSSFGDINPKLILSIDDNELKKIGLSERKVDYIKTLATAIINQEINFNSFLNDDDKTLDYNLYEIAYSVFDNYNVSSVMFKINDNNLKIIHK